MEPNPCGFACVSMILKPYGPWSACSHRPKSLWILVCPNRPKSQWIHMCFQGTHVPVDPCVRLHGAMSLWISVCPHGPKSLWIRACPHVCAHGMTL